MDGPRLLALVGPTASGKTEASLPIAHALEAEILCVDSMLVYRGMDVGTAKPTRADRTRVPHHLLDLAEPTESFSVARFQAVAHAAVDDVVRRGRRPLLVGGSGLYFRAVVDELRFPGMEPAVRGLLEAEAVVLGPEALHRRLASFDPEAASAIQPSNGRRVVRALEVAAITGRPFSSHRVPLHAFRTPVRVAGVEPPRPVLHRRIEQRVSGMLPGLLDETARLVERGFGGFLTSSQAIGYAEAMAVLDGRVSEAEAVERTVRRTKTLARRQLSWFRRDPRVRWFEVGEEGALGRVDDLLAFLRDESAGGSGGEARTRTVEA